MSMGSYEIDTARTTPGGVGYKNTNNNSTNTNNLGIAETEEVKTLRASHQDSLATLRELFENWTDEDLLFALKDSDGDLELTVSRISDGHANQWGEVKSRKHKKESNTKVKASSGVSSQRGQSSRGGGGGGHNDRFNNERGRSREGGNYRGGKFSSSDRERRQASQASQRRENGAGNHIRPPRQQNGPSHHHGYPNEANGSWNKRNGETINNSSGWANDTTTSTTVGTRGDSANETKWQTDTGSSLNLGPSGDTSTHHDDNNNTAVTDAKSAWGNENASSSFKSPLDTKESPTTGGGGWNSPKPSLNNNENITTTTNNSSNGAWSATDNKDSNDAYSWSSTPAAKDSWSAEPSKDSWTANNSWGESKLEDDITSHSPRPTNASKPVTAAKSPISRTIPAQSKTSWAQIVKPESKPEPRPEPISSPSPKVSSEIPKSVSPRLPKTNTLTSNITNTNITTTTAASLQSSPTPKSFEPYNEPASIPSISSPEITTPSPVTDTSKTTEENLKEYVKEASQLEHSIPSVASSPLVNASPRTKEILPPGLNNKSKGQTAARRMKQDTPVVMPAGAGVERVGVQFGSLSLTSPTPEHAELESTSPVPTSQTIEDISSSIIATETQIQQQQVSQNATSSLLQTPQLQQQITTNDTSSSSTTHGTAPNPTPTNINTFNPTYFKQQEQTSAAYMGQQPHLGLGEPYSYLPTQPPSQISGFGIGPMQSLPDQYASPVTSNAYQTRDTNKYAPETNSTTTTSAASPYGYPAATPTTPNAPPHHYSHSSNSGYDEVTVATAAAAANIHHLPGSGVPGVHDYQKAYGAGTGGGIPQLQTFLNSGANNNQGSGGVSAVSNSSSGGKNGSNGNELNPSNQYKGYDKSSSAGGVVNIGVNKAAE
ncbi:10535_t:CDS:10 [Ambispora gerdemannii]|uniref:RNA polymerase II degradation factor 1 n=1 Tax=Ambispora gerdemannii TaxID=144530 RepID=A0A9N8ZL49_9GLOM|nr:10535_t:CDS:10 [Ambispora gerdemannii]